MPPKRATRAPRISMSKYAKQGRKKARLAVRLRRGRMIGQLTTKRFVNLATSATLDVDGTVCQKSGGYLQVTSPAGLGNYATVYGSGSVYFQLSTLPDVSDYGNLFDRYKILGVAIRIIPVATNVATEGSVLPGSFQTPLILHTIQDFDDAQRPTNSEAGVNEMRQYPNYKCLNIYAMQGKPYSCYIRPKVAKSVYAGMTTAYQSSYFPWIDMANQNAQGYGFKFIIETVTKNNTQCVQAFKIEASYYLKFRNPR